MFYFHEEDMNNFLGRLKAAEIIYVGDSPRPFKCIKLWRFPRYKALTLQHTVAVSVVSYEESNNH